MLSKRANLLINLKAVGANSKWAAAINNLPAIEATAQIKSDQGEVRMDNVQPLIAKNG